MHKSTTARLITAASAVEKIIAPWVDAGQSAPALIDAVTEMRGAIAAAKVACPNPHGLRFFYNGIKVGKGKLQRASYSNSPLTNYPPGTLTIYAPGTTGRFSAEIGEAFEIQNGSDSSSDYFESDRIRVRPDHPLHALVLEAHQLAEGKRARRYENANA